MDGINRSETKMSCRTVMFMYSIEKNGTGNRRPTLVGTCMDHLAYCTTRQVCIGIPQDGIIYSLLPYDEVDQEVYVLTLHKL